MVVPEPVVIAALEFSVTDAVGVVVIGVTGAAVKCAVAFTQAVSQPGLAGTASFCGIAVGGITLVEDDFTELDLIALSVVDLESETFGVNQRTKFELSNLPSLIVSRLEDADFIP